MRDLGATNPRQDARRTTEPRIRVEEDMVIPNR